MLFITLKPDEVVHVLDEQGNHLGAMKAHQRGYSVRVSFDGFKQLTFKRRPAPSKPRKKR